MPALDATIAGDASNSYVTLDQANTYFAKRLGGIGAWTALNDDDKTTALLAACQDFEQFRYKGSRRFQAQALSFPRVPQREGWEVIPLAVQNAQCEQALHQAQYASTGGVSPQQKQAMQNLKSFQTGTHKEESRAPLSQVQLVCGPAAYRWLLPWISNTGQILMPQEMPRQQADWFCDW